MSRLAEEDLLNLPVADRLQLVQDLWDSIAETPEFIVLSEDEKRELDRRLNAYKADPTAGASWDAVLERIRNQE